MQPLKRFTQCGSLTMLFLVFIVLFGVSSTALTTFGKASPNNIPPAPPTQPPVKGRECNSHADCSSLQYTSCVRDLDDEKLRCLCGDNKAPFNGQCTAITRGLHHLCTDNSQCEEDMICGMENATKTTGFNRNSNTNFPQPQNKVCLCDEANGIVEEVKYHSCNGGIQLVTGIFIPLTSLFVGSILAKNRFH
ncbi:hypothetical protein Bhyg_11337 [Pseudolycoriella hygida]|uniref:Uncharacterized protein n=1 Tax=Pseudolycoriella hygida TaxID=35572 RepID=A0A9Q0MWZ0_9DIPT|nr:hypothetical protein Bhyg_11337 [Pseudolycoriella hygida]